MVEIFDKNDFENTALSNNPALWSLYTIREISVFH